MKISLLISLAWLLSSFSTSKALAIRPPKGAGFSPRQHRSGGHGGNDLTQSFLTSSIRGGWGLRTTIENNMPSLHSSSSASNGEAKKRPSVDFAAIGKYGTALAIQLSLIFGLLTGIDKMLARFAIKIPFYANVIFFYLFNLKTSIFLPLPSKREQKDWEYQERQKPSWTPPGVVFAIMWPLFVFGLRAFTAAMVTEATGVYASAPVMSLMLHLAVGTLWNTM